MRLAFSDTAATVEVPECPRFLAALQAAAPDWPFRRVRSSDPPAAEVGKRNGRYVIKLPEEEEIEASAVAAACSVICDVAMAFADERPDQLSLHCAAVLVAGRLVVMPSRSHAGKSTLVARLAADGHAVFGDDMLLVDRQDEHGIALGVAPRLRLPLPRHAGDAFAAFVARHSGARDRRYLYLDMPPSLLARRGDIAPVGAVVLLDRQAEGPARLWRAPANAAIQALIRQNVTLCAAPADLLRRAAALIGRVPCLTMAYSDLDEAAALFRATFSQWPLRIDPSLPVRPYRLDAEQAARLKAESRATGGAAAKVPVRLFAAGQAMLRHPDVVLQLTDREAFLAGGGGRSILHLNETGMGLWNLLAAPVSELEAVEALAAAFPDAERMAIERDVAAVFLAFAEAGMIVPAR